MPTLQELKDMLSVPFEPAHIQYRVWDDLRSMEHVRQPYFHFEHDHYAMTVEGLRAVMRDIPDDFIMSISQEQCGDFTMIFNGPEERRPFCEEEIRFELDRQKRLASERAERDKVLEEVRERSRKTNPCGILGLQWQDHLKGS